MKKCNEEILSVISAAVASMESRKGYRLTVKSYRRMPGRIPVWNLSGRMKIAR